MIQTPTVPSLFARHPQNLLDRAIFASASAMSVFALLSPLF